MREFLTAAKDSTGEDDVIEVPLDGVLYKAYKPTDGQFAFVMATTGKHSSTADQVAGQINFFLSMFEQEDADALAQRLLDRRDPFGVEEVTEIMSAMLEEWSGRPTKPSSGSSPSPRTTGRKSTQRTPKSLSSTSPSTDS
jgi:hypothetical protein